MSAHKHAEVIKAWADGAEIECRIPDSTLWHPVARPEWNENFEYRVKPAREYPKTLMTHGDLYNAYKNGRNDGDVVWNSAGCAAVANAALRHAIDSGQVIVPTVEQAIEFGRHAARENFK